MILTPNQLSYALRDLNTKPNTTTNDQAATQIKSNSTMSCPHPFLVDQRAYIPRPNSASSNRSSTSTSTSSSSSRSTFSSSSEMYYANTVTSHEQARTRAHATALQSLIQSPRPCVSTPHNKNQTQRAGEISESILQAITSSTLQFGSVSPRSSRQAASIEEKKARGKGMMAKIFQG